MSSFIGRARELQQTAAALSEARLVTLTGPRWARPGWRCGPPRRWQRVSVTAPGCVNWARCATQLGWTMRLRRCFQSSPRPARAAATLCGSSRSKQLLLVLDNCEHLLEAAAALAGVLQRSCERLVILATSREGLGIEGERLMPVPPHGVPGAGADLSTITEAEAVRLFAERAAAVKPGFAVTPDNAAAVAAAVRRLDGLALAIEPAAARVAAMTPAELARRLERSFGVLAARRRGALPHHQTLRATIDWSFQLLAEPEQALLARLSACRRLHPRSRRDSLRRGRHRSRHGL